MAPSQRPRVAPGFFEQLYAAQEDPWNFTASDYERDKYAHTLSVLSRARYGPVLEVGCSIGVFSALLAQRCERLLAVDVSVRAIERARIRLRGHPAARVQRAAFPEQMPPGPWDLVVCSEVLYYLDEAAFSIALARLQEALRAGAEVVAVHWRPSTETYPLRGDEVHDQLIAALAGWHSLDERRPQYRLDRFGGREPRA